MLEIAVDTQVKAKNYHNSRFIEDIFILQFTQNTHNTLGQGPRGPNLIGPNGQNN